MSSEKQALYSISVSEACRELVEGTTVSRMKTALHAVKALAFAQIA